MSKLRLVAVRDLPAMPESARRGIHVIDALLRGAPTWRRLEVPSAITLERLHEVLQETFGWDNRGPHSFLSVYGEFGGPVRPGSRAAKREAERRDESGVTLAQIAGKEGAWIAYVYGYRDEWRVDILAEKIRPATPGVAYPRCTGGHGEDTPGDLYGGVREFNAEREEEDEDEDEGAWQDDYFDPEYLTDDLSDLATVIIPAPNEARDVLRLPLDHLD